MIELRGPTDPDNYRVKTGRFGERFYTDPLPADLVWPETSDDDVHPAVSTVKKATGQDWSKAMVKRLAKAPSQLVEIGNIPSEFERKQRLSIVDDAGLDGASGRGTIVHSHAEARLQNRMAIYQMDDTIKPYIRTLDKFFDAYQPKLVAVEFVAIHRSLNAHNIERGKFAGYGGTGDAVVEIDGKLYLVDWKSRAMDSEHKAYPEEGAQVAAYGKADYWIVGADNANGAERIAPPELEGGLIVSIKPDSYECYPIDLDKGFDYWTDLHAWWQARRSETKSIGRKWAPRVAPTSSLVTVEPDSGAYTEEMTEEFTAEQFAEEPTVESNKERFKALGMVEQNAAREAFKRGGLNPNNPATARRVGAILAGLEARPKLREMQEQRAAEKAERTEPQPTVEDRLIAEGGEATDEMIGEARLMFDMVIGDTGKKWTGWRVQEANAAGVSIQLSALRSVKRAHIYLALCRWATWRGELLPTDEGEDNIEFTVLLNMVAPDTTGETLGLRLASLTTEQAEQFGTLIVEVVESETGEQLATEPESQPASQPTETEE